MNPPAVFLAAGGIPGVLTEREEGQMPHAHGLARARQAGRQVAGRYESDPFWYSTPLVALGASGTTTTLISIQEDAEFVAECTMVTAFVTAQGADEANVGPATNIVAPGPAQISFEFTDTGSGRKLMDRPIVDLNIAGVARDPYWFPIAKHFGPGSVIQVVATELNNVATTYQLTFGGYKVYRQSSVPSF